MTGGIYMNYDIVIIGAGPGGIFSAYEAIKHDPDLKIGVFEAGNPLEQRHCPIDGVKVKACVNCPSCGIMNGFGGAGAFSDGKYNITNEFGGNLYEYVGKKEAIALMEYVDGINCSHGGEHTRLFTNNNTSIRRKTICTCCRHRFVIWARTSTMWCLRTCMQSSARKWTSISAPVSTKCARARRDIRSSPRKTKNTPADTASSPPGEAAANGCRASVIPWASIPNPTGSISACA